MCRPSTCSPPPTGRGGPTPNSTGCGHSPPHPQPGQSHGGSPGPASRGSPVPAQCPQGPAGTPSRSCRAKDVSQTAAHGYQRDFDSSTTLHCCSLAAAAPEQGEGLGRARVPLCRALPQLHPQRPPQTLIRLCRHQQNCLARGQLPGSLASSAARRGRAPPWPGRALPAPRWAPRDRAASAELPLSPLAARAQAETWKGAETSDFQQPLAGFPCIDSIPALPRLLTGSPRHSCAAEDAAEEPRAPRTPRGSAGIIGKLRYRVSK